MAEDPLSRAPFRPSRVRWRAVVVAVVAVTALAACADDSEPNDDATPDSTESQPAEGETSALQEAMAEIVGGDPGPYQVTYEVEGSMAEGLTTMTLAHDPPNEVQHLEVDGTTVRIITTDTTTICLDEGDGWQCIPDDTASDMGLSPDSFVPDFADESDVEGAMQDPNTEFRTDTVAGRSAICAVAPTTEDGISEGEICLDEESGFPLRVSGTGPEGDFVMEAVEFSDPDPDLFVPPAEPIELPGS